MGFKKITKEDVRFFTHHLSQDSVRQTEEALEKNASDETEDLHFLPELIIYPKTTEEIQQVLSYCYEQNICVTPRGAGTGLSGGSIPVKGGISLDFRKMNQIIDIDTENFQVTTQPGVITQVLQETVAEKGLFYPVDPASRGSCFIGGNVAENSGGPRAVKYGTVKNYVLNLEAVLPNGEVIITGANTLKNATGYDLTHLLVGSEGTLAVITKIVLKLIPLPQEKLLMLAPFTSVETACQAVNVIMKAGITPSALEFMEKDALVCASDYLNENPVEIPPQVKAHLLIEVDGMAKEQLWKQVEAINELLSPMTDEEILIAQDQKQQDVLWQLRRVVGEAAKKSSIYKEEDTVVPRAYLPELLTFVKEKGKKYGFQSICYGHAGDGNLHINILKGDMDSKKWNNDIPQAIFEIFSFVNEKKGTISGEHGIGLVQKNYLPIVFSSKTLTLMKAIKDIFDPKGILNPGKVLT